MKLRRTPQPNIKRLKFLLSYDAETGIFIWKNKPDPRANRVVIGDEAGWNSHGYIVITFDQENYPAHRLAWFLTYKTWPPILDHINGKRNENRIANLRKVNATQNCWNSAIRKNNTSGQKGVCYHINSGLWRSRLKMHGKELELHRSTKY